MSLVNDALKKARMEAARGDAAHRSLPSPVLGRGERSPRRAWAAGLLGMAVLAGLGGSVLYRAGKQSALRTGLVEPAPASSFQSSRLDGVEADSGGDAAPAEGPAPAHGALSEADAAPNARALPASIERPAEPTETRRPAPKERGARFAAASKRPQSLDPEPPENRPQAATPREEPGSQTALATTPTGPTEKAPRERSVSPGPAFSNRPATPDTATATSVAPAASAPGPDDPSPRQEPQEFLRTTEVPGIGPIELGGIAWSGDRPFALINGRVVRPGDNVSGLFVEDIQPNTVRLRGDGGDLVFRLK